MNGLELGLQALAGGITGYVTNTAAVKMIFRKVLGFGGVIIETREEFIENISQLVEREIINHGTLQSELSKDEFNLEVTKIVDNFLQRHLYDATQNISLGQVPQMPKSLNNLLDFLHEKQGGVIDDVLRLIFEAISLQDILSEKQLESLIGQGVDASLNIFRETDILDSFILSVYRQYREDALVDFIPSTVFDTVTGNLNKATAKLHRNLEENFDQPVQQLIDDLYAQFDLSSVVAEFEKSIKNKTLVELFGRTHAENMSNELLQHIIQFLKSPEGRSLLEQTSEYLFRTIKETRIPLFNLFKPELAVNIESFLASKLPSVVIQLIMWLKENQEHIENSIEYALQSTLAQESGLNAWMKKLIYEQFANNAFVSKFQVVAKVIQGIRHNVDVGVLSEDISSDIMDYLKNTNISEMICSLETRGIFTSDDITQLMERNMEKLIARVDLKATDSYFNKKLGELVQLPFAEPMEAFLKGLLLKFKQGFLYTAKFTETLQKELRFMIQEGSTKKFSDLVPAEDLDTIVPELKKNIISLLEKRKDDLVAIIVHESQKFVVNKKLSDISNVGIKDKGSRKIAEEIRLYTNHGLQEIQKKSIYSMYDRANTMPEMGTRLASSSIHLLNNNLEAITKGQIKAIVASNLSKLPSKQLQEVIEEFMGKELKPISWFGGFLGILAGLGFGLAKSRYNITGSLSLACSVPVYALVGYLTNKQALWMIFHPYRPWRVLGNDVPLTQGVIVKSKPRFAKSMARFVGEQLLNPQSSVKLFKGNRENLSNIFMKSISENNYQMVENYLITNTPLIASELLKAGYILVDKNMGTWSQKLAGELEHIALKAFDLGHLEEIIQEYGLDFPMKLQPSLVSILDERFHEQRSLLQVLPNQAIQLARVRIERYLADKLDQLQEVFTNQQIFDRAVASTFAQPFAILITKSLNELIKDEQKEAVKKRTGDIISTQLRSESSQKKIQEVIHSKISKELDPNKKIIDLFEGQLFEVLSTHVHPILDLLTEKITTLLNKERGNLKSVVKKEAQNAKRYVVANSLLNIDLTIDHLVDRLVDETAPEIMSHSRADLSAFLLKSLSNIGESRINEIGIDLTEQGIADIVSNVLENETLNKHVRVLSGGMIESITNIPLERMLSVAGIKKAEDVLHILALELDLLRETFSDSFVTVEETLKKATFSVATKIFNDLASEISVSSIFDGVSQEDITQFTDWTLTKIKESKAFCTAVQEFAEAIVTYANGEEIKSIIDPAILQSDLRRVFSLLIQDEETTSKFKVTLDNTLKSFFINLNGIFEVETKDYIASITVESILNALQEQISDLVKTLDLRNITEREINNMEPREIEDIFNSFASRYFRKLEYYGLWGGLLGFIIDILITRI